MEERNIYEFGMRSKMPLKTNEQLTKNIYKTLIEKRNTAKTIVSKTHKESWDRFIFRIETDILGEQSMVYKVLNTSMEQTRTLFKLITQKIKNG